MALQQVHLEEACVRWRGRQVADVEVKAMESLLLHLAEQPQSGLLLVMRSSPCALPTMWWMASCRLRMQEAKCCAQCSVNKT